MKGNLAVNVVIETQKLCKSYNCGEMKQHIIKNLDVKIYNGDFTIFMGPSGSGKSTILHLLSGMDYASMGDIFFKGNNFTKYTEKELSRFRKSNCGYVFQSIHLISSMSAMDNILISGLLSETDKKKVILKAKELFSSVGLTEKEWNKFPSQISGGQMGRVGIVRALINNPEVIFADEPTGALDSTSGLAVLDLLTKFNSDECQTTIMVTHDFKSALRGNRILYLKDGRICGECVLGKYISATTERKKILLDFLENMGW